MECDTKINLSLSEIFQIVIFSQKRGQTPFLTGIRICQITRQKGSGPFFLNQFSGGNSEWVPPDPFSNSEVKTLSADGSVGSPHVRVGHRQDLFMKGRCRKVAAFFMNCYAEPSSPRGKRSFHGVIEVVK